VREKSKERGSEKFPIIGASHEDVTRASRKKEWPRSAIAKKGKTEKRREALKVSTGVGRGELKIE